MSGHGADDSEFPSSLDQLNGSQDASEIGSSQERLSTRNYVPPSDDETVSMVAKALSSLSIDERSQLIDEVHGVSKPLDEDPDFILSSLTAFDVAIESSKTALYEMALTQNRKYVEGDSLRLMFLRSEQFSVLPKKDRAGRSVIAVFPSLREFKNPENMMRAIFFVEMCTFRDVEVQKKGVVFVFYNKNIVPDTDTDTEILQHSKQHTAAMPTRYAAIHTCILEQKDFALAGVAVSSRQQDYAKSNVHYGTVITGNEKECMLELRRFGIPTECFPVTNDGSIDVQQHRAWVKQKEAELQIQLDWSSFSETALLKAEVGSPEESALENDNTEESETTAALRAQTSDFKTLLRATEMAPNSLIQPTLKDVVLGRGRWFQDFPGNIAFRTYLADRSDEYDKADRAGKNILTKSVIRSLNASGTRFLGLSSPTNGIPMWEEASFKEVYNKISQCYRSARKTKNG
eukprot:scaffold5392_cov107-Cylindrotheca_fusiformis.AAC.6